MDKDTSRLVGNVLLTGGAGFLCRGIMRRARLEGWNVNFTVFSRDEYKQDLCRRKYPEAEYILGDIRDTDRLSLAMRRHDTVIHAAALKYVPQAEYNVSECISINVGGSQSVVAAARAADVSRVCAISTDKAVEPLNTYGITKALGERVFTEAARQLENKFVTCRYGNVVGSTGSVVPVFQHQKESQGFVTVTDPSMTRFWISVDDAIDLILFALVQPSGSIIIPEPESLEVGELVKAVCGEDIKMEIIGTRPGEKCHEKLLTHGESVKTIADTFYVYHPDAHPVTGEITLKHTAIDSFELSSDKAARMNSARFATLAEDALSV